MKFNMMIGGVETLFPDAEIRYSKKTNEVVICFLKIKKLNLQQPQGIQQPNN